MTLPGPRVDYLKILNGPSSVNEETKPNANGLIDATAEKGFGANNDADSQDAMEAAIKREASTPGANERCECDEALRSERVAAPTPNTRQTRKPLKP